MNTSYKTYLLQLLSNASINEALSILDGVLVHGRYYADLVHYKFRHRELETSFSKGLFSPEEYTKERAKFTNGLIAFTHELDEQELLHQILLLSPTKAAHDKIAERFKRYFPNTAEEFEGKLLENSFAFVVCNDFDTPPEQQESFDNLMQDYLEKGYLLVCASKSNQKAIVSANRDKVHAANSPFALFARVREMIDYVRYFR